MAGRRDHRALGPVDVDGLSFALGFLVGTLTAGASLVIATAVTPLVCERRMRVASGAED